MTIHTAPPVPSYAWPIVTCVPLGHIKSEVDTIAIYPVTYPVPDRHTCTINMYEHKNYGLDHMSQLLRKIDRYKLFIYSENNHLRVEISGNIPIDSIRNLWNKIFDECQKTDCREILIISDMQPHDTMKAFNTQHTLQVLQSNRACNIAWVEHNTISLQVMNFIKDLIDRETPQKIKFFNDQKFAQHWLFGKMYEGLE